jgi:NADH-quinone oxidoreductase subunit K
MFYWSLDFRFWWFFSDCFCCVLVFKIRKMFYFYLSIIVSLLVIALWGLLLKRSTFIHYFLVLELIYLVVYLLAGYSLYLGLSVQGRLGALLLLAVAGTESALGLALLINLYQGGGSIVQNEFRSLRL